MISIDIQRIVSCFGCTFYNMEQFIVKKRLKILRKRGTYSRLRKKYNLRNKRSKNRETSSIFEDTFVEDQNAHSEYEAAHLEGAIVMDQQTNPIISGVDYDESKGKKTI